MSLAQRCIFLQDVFQMTAIALMTHLYSSCEVVYNPDTLFFQYGTNLLIDGLSELFNRLWIVLISVVLQEPPEIKIWGGSD